MLIALGWCEDTARPPDGVTAKPLAGLALLAAAANSPREVLALQQLCFDQGIDLLPLSAARSYPVDVAKAEAVDRLGSLRRQLAHLRGKAQITLQLQWDEIVTQAVSGRDWLLARQAKAARATAARLWLTGLAQALALPATEVELRGETALIHLLTPRDALPTSETLARLAREMPDPAPFCRLTVVGPWPPHAFVEAA